MQLEVEVLQAGIVHREAGPVRSDSGSVSDGGEGLEDDCRELMLGGQRCEVLVVGLRPEGLEPGVDERLGAVVDREQVCYPACRLGGGEEELAELLAADLLTLLQRVRCGLGSLGRLVGGAL